MVYGYGYGVWIMVYGVWCMVNGMWFIGLSQMVYLKPLP
jgi:hypothetical protein